VGVWRRRRVQGAPCARRAPAPGGATFLAPRYSAGGEAASLAAMAASDEAALGTAACGKLDSAGVARPPGGARSPSPSGAQFAVAAAYFVLTGSPSAAAALLGYDAAAPHHVAALPAAPSLSAVVPAGTLRPGWAYRVDVTAFHSVSWSYDPALVTWGVGGGLSACGAAVAVALRSGSRALQATAARCLPPLSPLPHCPLQARRLRPSCWRTSRPCPRRVRGRHGCEPLYGRLRTHPNRAHRASVVTVGAAAGAA